MSLSLILPGDNAVGFTVAGELYVLSFYFVHDLMKADVAEDEAGLRPVNGWNVPRLASTHFLRLPRIKLTLAENQGKAR